MAYFKIRLFLAASICSMASSNVFALPVNRKVVASNVLKSGDNSNDINANKFVSDYLGKSHFVQVYLNKTTTEFSLSMEDLERKSRWPIVVGTVRISGNGIGTKPKVSLESTLWNISHHENLQTPQLVTVDRAGFIRSIKKLSSQATDISKEVEQASKILDRPEFERIQVGLPAPDFTLADMNGQQVRLSELKGKKNLLLTFFPKCFTGGCATHLSSLRDQWPALQKQDTEVWGVSVDPGVGEKGQLAFAKQLGLSFPMIPDTGRNLSLLFGAVNTPTQLASRMSVLIDKKGIVRWVDKQINIPTHGADVVAKIQELGLGPK